MNINDICIKGSVSIRHGMEIIDRTKEGIVLVVDEDGILIGTVTDGDIRRFILSGKSLDESIETISSKKPVTALVGASEHDLLGIMRKHSIRHVPVVDQQGHPVKIVNLRDIVFEERGNYTAVIMAGGEGKRLRPLTESVPKPMIKIGGKPILETIITQLVQYNITDIFISVNYKADVIEKYFNDGAFFGAKITYLKEEKKLGTAGSLTLLPSFLSKPFLVINGDVLTRTDFSKFTDFHSEHKCLMTVAGIQYVLNIPFGVLNTANHFLLGVQEKPQQRFLCNAGIYILNPELIDMIPCNEYYDMTDLINDLVRKGLPIATFPIYENWIDIGRMEELERARNEMEGG